MKLSDYLEEIAGAISSSDMMGVAMPLLGLIRRPVPTVGTGAPATRVGGKKKKKKKSKKRTR